MSCAASHLKPGLIDVEMQIHTGFGGGWRRGEYTAGPLAGVRPEPHTFEVVLRQSDQHKQQP